MNYIIKIISNRLPVLAETPVHLTSAHIESIVEGDYIFGVPHHDLKAKFPLLSLVFNADNANDEEHRCFDLPFNELATRLHKVLAGGVYGSAILAFVAGGVPYPLTEAEATDIRETIERLCDISFEEGAE